MKKKNLKTLKLQKQRISNLKEQAAHGGRSSDDTHDLTVCITVCNAIRGGFGRLC